MKKKSRKSDKKREKKEQLRGAEGLKKRREWAWERKREGYIKKRMKESIIYEEISIENKECIEEDGKEKKGKSKLGEVGGNTFATIAKERNYAT